VRVVFNERADKELSNQSGTTFLRSLWIFIAKPNLISKTMQWPLTPYLESRLTLDMVLLTMTYLHQLRRADLKGECPTGDSVRISSAVFTRQKVKMVAISSNWITADPPCYSHIPPISSHHVLSTSNPYQVPSFISSYSKFIPPPSPPSQ
jgi:hypothetical protein